MVASPGCRAFRVELRDGRGYWTVVDDEYVKVPVADRFLFDLRFGRDRAESTTRVYAASWPDSFAGAPARAGAWRMAPGI